MQPVGPKVRHNAHFERVIGTSFELQTIGTPLSGPLAEAAALHEIDRLELIFSRFRPDSELSRWQETFDEPVEVSPDLAEILWIVEHWRSVTDGAFDPSAQSGEPSDLAPLSQLQGTSARRLTKAPLSLDALAKGAIIDAAAKAAADIEGVDEVVVNIGGDLRHIGRWSLSVAVTDPFAPAENAPVIATVRIRNQGVATSGNYRRGPHVIDPRSGEPITGVASATVVADNARDADALATAFAVLSPKESIALANRQNVACFIVSSDRKRHSNAAWRKLK